MAAVLRLYTGLFKTVWDSCHLNKICCHPGGFSILRNIVDVFKNVVNVSSKPELAQIKVEFPDSPDFNM